MKFGHKMGQAKQRKTASAKIFDDLQEQFSKEGIDTALFGFYDQPAFLKQEQKNAEFLHSYAKWVMYRPITDVYREKAISIVPKVAELVAQILKEDHIEGGCIAAAGLITRILDRLGVWSFGLSGSANFETINPRIWRGLHSVDFLDQPSAASDHAWVCAPPFYIVDASANTQRWGGSAIKSYIPMVILDVVGKKTKPLLLDIVSVEKQAQYRQMEGKMDTNLHHRLEPRLQKFGSDFPAIEVQQENLTARYVPLAIRVTDCPLEEINTESGRGRTGKEIWENVVLPTFNI